MPFYSKKIIVQWAGRKSDLQARQNDDEVREIDLATVKTMSQEELSPR